MVQYSSEQVPIGEERPQDDRAGDVYCLNTSISSCVCQVSTLLIAK